jgi:hypothetical protein
MMKLEKCTRWIGLRIDAMGRVVGLARTVLAAATALAGALAPPAALVALSAGIGADVTGSGSGTSMPIGRAASRRISCASSSLP